MIKNKKTLCVEKKLTKQQEVMLKRLLLQNNLNTAGVQDNEKITDIDPSTVSLAVLNKIGWELAIITAEKLDDEWDHIIAGFDDPKFDWASANLPTFATYSEVFLNEDWFGNFIADRLTNEHLSLVVTKTIDANKQNVELMHRLLVTLCNYDLQICRDCFREAIVISSPECGDLEGLLELIEKHIE